MIFQLAGNIGLQIEGLFGDSSSDLKENAWKFVKTHIDEGSPCYGWQIGLIPDFYVIYGYDETGYHYKGYFEENGAGPKKWDEIGQMFIEIYRVKRIEPKGDTHIVKSALEKVLRHASNPTDWIFDGYKSGIEGLDKWIHFVNQGTAGQFGNAYNSGVWAECRNHGVDFLEEANERIGGKAAPLFADAIEKYTIVAEHLSKVSSLYPHSPQLPQDHIGVDEKSRKATESLKVARTAEAEGLEILSEIVKII